MGSMTLPKRAIGPMTESDLARFWAKVDTSGECWLWTAGTVNGYGSFSLIGRKGLKAHRVSWAIAYGEPDTARQSVIDHLCRNVRCVRPDHLEQVTQRENVLRGTAPAALQARRTHCKEGHPLSGDNLLESCGRRICLACKRRWANESNARKRAQNV